MKLTELFTGICLIIVVSFSVYNRNTGDAKTTYTKEPRVTPVNVLKESHFNIKDRQGVKKAHTELVSFIWGSEGIPDNAEITENQNITYPNFSIKNTTVHSIRTDMDFGLSSTAYHFIPEDTETKGLFVYHHGHLVSFRTHGMHTIKGLLKEGYSVLAFDMVCVGFNTPKPSDKVKTHEDIGRLKPDKGSPLKYFIEPVVRALNFVEQNYEYTHYHMTGISGGGWTTVLVSAVDFRISRSFPVAGALPIYLREAGSTGDWEQRLPELYNKVTYLDLYLLGACNGRKQVQINNYYDTCCFKQGLGLSYSKRITQVASKLGGTFSLTVDKTHTGHAISNYALYVMIQHTDNTPPSQMPQDTPRIHFDY